MHIEAAIHVANLVLGFLVLFLMIDGMTNKWAEFPSEVKLLHGLALSLIFGLLIVSTSQLAADMPLSYDAAVITLVKLSALYILWKTRKTLYRTGTRYVNTGQRGGNEDSDSPNRNILAKGNEDPRNTA